MIRKIFKIFLIIFLVIILTNCGSIAVSPITYYQLNDSEPVKLSTYLKSHLTILVSVPISNPGYQTSAMIYTLTPYELSSYVNSQWIAPPAEMLIPLLVQALRRTGYFYSVISSPFFGVTSYRLDTRLLKLQQEIFFPINRIRLTIEASLIKSGTNQIIASHLFEALVTTRIHNPYGSVLAANQAAIIISRRIAQFCAFYAH